MKVWCNLKRAGTLAQSLGISVDLLLSMDAALVDGLMEVQEAMEKE